MIFMLSYYGFHIITFFLLFSAMSKCLLGGANSEPWLFRHDDLHWGAMAGDAYKDWVSKIGYLPNFQGLRQFGSTRFFWVSNWIYDVFLWFCHVFQHFGTLGKYATCATLFCLLIKVHSLSLKVRDMLQLLDALLIKVPKINLSPVANKFAFAFWGSPPSLPVLSHAQKYGLYHF